jgi:hypothetical protein
VFTCILASSRITRFRSWKTDPLFLRGFCHRDAVGAVLVSAVGVVPDSPGEAGDGEGAGVHVLDIVYIVLGSRVAVDLEHVIADSTAGEDGRGGARGHAVASGGTGAQQNRSHGG